MTFYAHTTFYTKQTLATKPYLLRDDLGPEKHPPEAV